jgi:hypothetical protein
MKNNLFLVFALLLLAGLAAPAETTIYSDDFNRASLGSSYTISQGGGGGTAFIVSSTALWLTNGTPSGWVSVATNLPNGGGFNATLDSCSGLVVWTFNMRFGRTVNTPSGFTSASYGNAFVLAADNLDFSAAGAKGYAVLFGNGGSPDTFRLVAFTNGIKADYTAAGSVAGNALIVGTGAFAVTTQAVANDYYSFKATYDPTTKIWTVYGRDDGASAFADPASGSFTTIGTFTETTAIFRATALGRTGAYWVHSTGANNPSQFDNFRLSLTTSVAIANVGTPPIGSVLAGVTDVPLFGFRLSPSGGSVDFTGLNLTTTGTATTSDLNNFRVVYDADNSGTYNGGETVVSGSGAALASPISFAITGQTGFSAARRYLVIADVAAGATLGATFTGSILAAGDVTTTGTPGGTAAGNQQTITSADIDLTMAGGGETATISSLTNDAAITSANQGVQAWQVTFSNPAGNGAAGAISAITFTQGASNGVANWQNTIQAAELFDGSTALAAGTISTTGIAFSGLSVGVADGGTRTLTLRISLKSTAGAQTDKATFQFTLAGGDVAVAGNGVTTASINSDQTRNQIAVVATKLAFSSVPVTVTNGIFSASVQAQDANGNLDLDDATSVTITLATGAGTLAGGGSQNLANGAKIWAALAYDAAGIFTIQAAGGSLATATSGSITATLAPALSEVFMPLFIQGGLSSNSKRVPFAYCVALSNLTAGATYRYFNQCVVSGDSATVNGAGNCILASSSGSFVRTTSPAFTTAANYGEFTTDANGSYTGWFLSEPTGNSDFSTAGNQVFMRIMLNNGAGGTTVATRLTTADSATVLAFATSGTNAGTGIRGNSLATNKNFVLLYDNVAGTGRPLAAALVESDGLAENTAASYVQFYNDSVDGTNGSWGTIIPNNNTNGVKRIEQRKLSDGSLVGVNTDSDGLWPSGANTINPSGGSGTEIFIAASDAPLNNAAGTNPTIPAITYIRVSGVNVLIDFTGGASDAVTDFTVLGSTNLPATLSPIAAAITTAGPGLFRATIPLGAPAAFYRIKR